MVKFDIQVKSQLLHAAFSWEQKHWKPEQRMILVNGQTAAMITKSVGYAEDDITALRSEQSS